MLTQKAENTTVNSYIELQVSRCKDHVCKMNNLFQY